MLWLIGVCAAAWLFFGWLALGEMIEWTLKQQKANMINFTFRKLPGLIVVVILNVIFFGATVALIVGRFSQ